MFSSHLPSRHHQRVLTLGYRIDAIEKKIGAGLIEEVIQVAEGELQLVDEMLRHQVYVLSARTVHDSSTLLIHNQMGGARREVPARSMVLLRAWKPGVDSGHQESFLQGLGQCIYRIQGAGLKRRLNSIFESSKIPSGAFARMSCLSKAL